MDCSVIYIVSHGVLRCINYIIYNILRFSNLAFISHRVSARNCRSRKTHGGFSRDLVWHCLGENRIGLKTRWAGPIVYLTFFTLVLFHMSRWQCSQIYRLDEVWQFATRERSRDIADLKEEVFKSNKFLKIIKINYRVRTKGADSEYELLIFLNLCEL